MTVACTQCPKMYGIVLIMLIARSLAGGLKMCDLENSVDISSGIHTNGDILYKDEVYTRHEYFIDNESLAERGCVCLKKTCIRKCCPIEQGYTQQKTCVNLNGTAFDPPIWDSYTKQSAENVSKFGFVIGKMGCGENRVRLKLTNVLKGSLFGLQVDGTLFIKSPGNIVPWTKKEPDEYCIDTFVEEDEKGRISTKLDALVCFPKDADDYQDNTISFTCMLISCVFFIVTIAVYALLPELQNLHGRVLMVYLACMCVGFFFLATLQILLTINKATLTLCIGLTFVIYFSLLSAFFWLNVMCFDIWWTFSGKRGLSLEKLSMRARFCAYAAYAFGFPTGFTILLAALEFSGLPAHPLLPMMGERGCFLHGFSKLLYLYGPMLVLCIANLVFFVMTAWKITKIKQQTQKTLKSKDSSSTDQHRNDRQRLLLYIKLFTIMGINWILEVISGLYPQANDVWRFIDAYNVMIGVFIFIIFVCKRKIFRLMKKRYHQMRGRPMSRTQTQTTSTRTLSTRDDYRMNSIKNNQV